MKNTQQQYNSLGEMIKKQDFRTLYEKLLQYESSPDRADIKILAEPNGPCSELDLILFNIPRFATKQVSKRDKEKEENSVEEDFLDTLLTDDNIGEAKKDEILPYVLEVVDVLLRNGANPNVTVVNGVTPFMMACTVNNADLMRKEIENEYKELDFKTGEYTYYKADIEKGDGKGHRPLYYAAMTQATDVMDALVKEYGADIDFQYMFYDNQTVFHLACKNFADEIKVDKDGLTFKEAEGETKDKTIDKLIELGADPTILDDLESLPEEYVPVFDEEIHDEGDISEEELAIWEATFEKVGNYRKVFEENKTSTHKLTF